jgi:hypothetical protein
VATGLGAFKKQTGESRVWSLIARTIVFWKKWIFGIFQELQVRDLN